MKKIDVSGWKKFKIEDVFMIKKPDVRSEKYYEEGAVNYVSSGAFNNGVMKCLKPKEGEVLDKGRCITVSPLDGSSFWQEDDFLGRGGSGASIALLYNDNLNQLNALFICSVIKKSAGKYGYANLLNGNNLKNLEVILPAITKYIPDFDTLTREVSGGGINMNRIDTSSWKEFEISELFDVQTTKSTDKLMLNFADDGKYDFVGRTALNNGVQGKLNNLGYDANPAKTFSVVQVGQTCCLYREREWYASQNIFILYPKYEDLITHRFFITTCINKMLAAKYQDAYTYPSLAELKKIKVLLPAKAINEPDWQFMEDYIKEIQKKVQNKTFKQKGHRKKIDITTAGNKTEEEWKRFKVGYFFDAERGSVKGLQKQEPGKVPVIAAAGFNQGIAGFYDVSAVYKDKITVSCNGAGCGSAFYHDYDFNITGDAIVLIDKQEFSHAVKEFIACMLNGILTRKYSYEEKCSADKVKEEEIFLPANENGQPDWEKIEKFMCSIADNSRDTLSRITLSELQDIYKKVTFASGGGRWKRFCIGDYFSVEYGKFRPKKELGNGNINYITTSGFNNGVTDTYTTAEHQGNYITVASDGALMGTAFYQKEPFSTSNIVSTLTPFSSTPLNEYNALFLCAIIYQKRGEFGWLGYKFSVDRVRNLMVLLPADNAGNPDWDYMENYIKELTTKTSKNIDLLSKVS